MNSLSLNSLLWQLLLNCSFFVFLLHIIYALFLTRLGMKASLVLPRWLMNALQYLLPAVFGLLSCDGKLQYTKSLYYTRSMIPFTIIFICIVFLRKGCPNFPHVFGKKKSSLGLLCIVQRILSFYFLYNLSSDSIFCLISPMLEKRLPILGIMHVLCLQSGRVLACSVAE